jgi:hypothetical protein
MIIAAIEKVAKKDAEGNTYIGRKALRDALFATRGLSGVTGTLSCDPYGDCADPKIAVYGWRWRTPRRGIRGAIRRKSIPDPDAQGGAPPH